MIGKKVTLELKRKTETPDGIGGITSTWAGLRYITGLLCNVRGTERLSADKLQVIADYYFYIDYPVGETITEEDMFQYGTRKYKIIFIYNMGGNQNKQLRITLLEEV